MPVDRPSLQLPEMPTTGPVTVVDASTDAPLFQARILLLGDSFTNAPRDALRGFFPHATLLHNEVTGRFLQAVADAMAQSDVIVLEIVERTIASGRGALIDDRSLATIEQTLAHAKR
jgi:hypothetical protein